MENLTELLNQLALKLGTTTEYLWEVMIKQAYIAGMLGSAYIVLTILAGWALYKMHMKFSQDPEVNPDSSYDVNEWPLYAITMAIMFYLTMVFIAFFVVGDTVTAFANPEYWALEKILNKL